MFTDCGTSLRTRVQARRVHVLIFENRPPLCSNAHVEDDLKKSSSSLASSFTISPCAVVVDDGVVELEQDWKVMLTIPAALWHSGISVGNPLDLSTPVISAVSHRLQPHEPPVFGSQHCQASVLSAAPDAAVVFSATPPLDAFTSEPDNAFMTGTSTTLLPSYRLHLQFYSARDKLWFLSRLGEMLHTARVVQRAVLLAEEAQHLINASEMRSSHHLSTTATESKEDLVGDGALQEVSSDSEVETVSGSSDRGEGARYDSNSNHGQGVTSSGSVSPTSDVRESAAVRRPFIVLPPPKIRKTVTADGVRNSPVEEDPLLLAYREALRRHRPHSLLSTPRQPPTARDTAHPLHDPPPSARDVITTTLGTQTSPAAAPVPTVTRVVKLGLPLPQDAAPSLKRTPGNCENLQLPIISDQPDQDQVASLSAEQLSAEMLRQLAATRHDKADTGNEARPSADGIQPVTSERTPVIVCRWCHRPGKPLCHERVCSMKPVHCDGCGEVFEASIIPLHHKQSRACRLAAVAEQRAASVSRRRSERQVEHRDPLRSAAALPTRTDTARMKADALLSYLTQERARQSQMPHGRSASASSSAELNTFAKVPLVDAPHRGSSTVGPSKSAGIQEEPQRETDNNGVFRAPHTSAKPSDVPLLLQDTNSFTLPSPTAAALASATIMTDDDVEPNAAVSSSRPQQQPQPAATGGHGSQAHEFLKRYPDRSFVPQRLNQTGAPPLVSRTPDANVLPQYLNVSPNDISTMPSRSPQLQAQNPVRSFSAASDNSSARSPPARFAAAQTADFLPDTNAQQTTSRMFLAAPGRDIPVRFAAQPRTAEALAARALASTPPSPPVERERALALTDQQHKADYRPRAVEQRHAPRSRPVPNAGALTRDADAPSSRPQIGHAALSAKSSHAHAQARQGHLVEAPRHQSIDVRQPRATSASASPRDLFEDGRVRRALPPPEQSALRSSSATTTASSFASSAASSSRRRKGSTKLLKPSASALEPYHIAVEEQQCRWCGAFGFSAADALKRHESTCTHRRMRCKHCGGSVRFSEKHGHRRICEARR